MNDASSLVDLEGVRAQVDALLTAHLDRLESELDQMGSGTAPLIEAMRLMLSGGKRLRAAFCYWSWRAHGGAQSGPGAVAALRVGAALELFQAAALFHDDVMDDSDTRRGLPAAHRSFAHAHRTAQWSGDDRRYGESAAILLGDLALIASEQEFSAAVADLDPDRATTTRAVFDRMRTEVTVGQYLDLQAQVLPWGTDPAGDERRAREVIRAKSARYSVEHPVLMGAALAGADQATLTAASGFGLPLGEAFQLRDDLLGVFGDPATTGKPAGDDLREGKRTVLVARAMAAAGRAGDRTLMERLRSELGNRGLSEADCLALAEAIRTCGAVDEVEQLIDELVTQADRAWEVAPLVDPGREMLARLGRAAVQRQA
ncbi:polyprenyl synthetase family protein [Cellulomonas sp. NPDC089187]|uniref:polyprenyl synthetase family protein n=1 Tax=Cellulomonas sp. NPDC089187 TaxID=3154970 RepID=UPI0034255155